MAARARACAARTRLFGFIATPNRALCAPPPIAASLLLIRSLKPANRSFADPSDDILWSKLCTGATICSTFFRFILLKNCFLILSFCYTLLILLFLSLLILLVLFFLFLFFSSSAIVTHTHTHRQSILDKYMIDSVEEIYRNQHFGSMPPPTPAS